MALSTEHLRTMLARCHENRPDVRCTFGQIAFWSARIGRAGEDVHVDPAAWGHRIGGELEFDGDRDALGAVLERARPELGRRRSTTPTCSHATGCGTIPPPRG